MYMIYANISYNPLPSLPPSLPLYFYLAPNFMNYFIDRFATACARLPFISLNKTYNSCSKQHCYSNVIHLPSPQTQISRQWTSLTILVAMSATADMWTASCCHIQFELFLEMCNIKWQSKVSNLQVLGKCRLTSIEYIIQSLLCWAGQSSPWTSRFPLCWCMTSRMVTSALDGLASPKRNLKD